MEYFVLWKRLGVVERKHWCVFLKGKREERETSGYKLGFDKGMGRRGEEDVFMKYERTNYYLFAPNTRTWPGTGCV